MERIGYHQLTYEQIPAYADKARKGDVVCLKLSRLRGSLYRWFVQREIRARSAKLSTWRFAIDLALMLLVLVMARRLILLAYYHEESLESYQSIQFEPDANGLVVWFNRLGSNKEANTI